MRLPTLIAALAALLVGLAAPALATASPQKRLSAGQERLEDYWTTARMRAATPVAAPSPASVDPAAAAGSEEIDPLARDAISPGGVSVARASGSRATSGRARPVRHPASGRNRAHGKVFFTLPGQGDFVCSGTVVPSRTKSTVWTAGHCVFDDRFASRWVFVPGYRDGETPLGVWSARRLATTGEWRRREDLSYDLGAARLRKADGRKIQRVTGARGIRFGGRVRRRIDAFGYPASPNAETGQDFDGERGFHCDTKRTGRVVAGSGPAAIKIACDMTQGASGGGWVDSAGRVISASSFVRSASGGRSLFGPYMGRSALRMYRAIAK